MRKKSRPTISLDLNTAEQVLMHRFVDVRALEDSMENIRQKYAEAWGAVFKLTYPSLNILSLRSNDNRGGRVGCGKISWPSAYPSWPSGFYIEQISFQSLCAHDEARPYACVWIEPPKNLHIDLDGPRKRIRQKAEDLLGHPLEEGRPSVGEISMWYNLPESRHELISALTRNGGGAFFAIMAKHLEFFRPLIPLVDAVFASGRKRSK
jgi:hypothetical protein